MHLLLVLSLLASQADPLEPLRVRFDQEKEKPAAQRLDAVTAVGALKTDAAAAFLSDIYEKDKDLEVRAQAIKALSECGGPAALKKLAAVAGDSKQPFNLRSASLEALTRPPTKEGLAACRAVLKEAGEIRLHAWAGLRSYPLAETEPLWRQGLQDSDALVRAMAMMALAPLKEVRLQDAARQALLNPDAEPLIKYASVTVLQASGGVVNARAFIAASATNDPTLRRLLAEALGSLTEEKAAQEIFAALRHADPAVRAVAARSLGRLKHANADDRISEPLKDRVFEVRAAALEAVAERRDKNSETILQREAQSSNEEVAAVAIGLLPAYPSEPTRGLLIKLAGNYKPAIALPALEALGDLRVPEALPAFEKALKAKDWPVRVAAIRGLAKLRSREAIDLLVDRMDKEDGRVLAEIGDALRGLTGKPFGYGPGQWKEWWTAQREVFAVPEKTALASAAGGGMTTYHGVPVLSNRMVFCVDISGSMSELSGTETRMDQAKRELARVLGALGKDSQVNLIFFDDRIETWHKQLVPIKSNLAQAQAIVGRLAPRGRTNIFDSLDAAFQHKEADTVYLLSDGDPTDGRIIDPTDILREIRRVNRLRQVVIHTISFGSSPFMKSLAEQNGGQYVEIK